MQIKYFLPGALAAAVAAQNSTATLNLTSLIASNENLSSLATLLKSYPQVVTGLASVENVTLFAPSNNALQAVQGTLASAASIPGYVEALLGYHVVQGEYFASNISSTPAFPHTTLNSSLYTNVTGGQVVECRLVGDSVEITSGLKLVSNVTQANLNFTGGVVHVIDSLLTLPLNFSSTAVAANLTALLGATEATNLTGTLDTLSDITIFAPSNSAFQDIATATANLTALQAAGILEYHVVNGSVAYSSSLSNGTIPTLGGNVTITIENGTVFVNSARVINSDILIAGGVMHIIDSVLNPNNTEAKPNASETSAAIAFSGASSASIVPFTSGVPTPSVTIPGLVTSETQIAASYSTATGTATAGSGASASAKSSSSTGIAAAPTGAIGAAALFGGAVVLANL